MIYAVVLAAGASTRMAAHGPKALLRGPDGRTFVTRVVETARAAGAGGVVVVVGPPHGDAIKRALPTGAVAVVNPRPERGMLSSVQAGVRELPAATSAVLIWPVDVPYVEVETARAILAAAPGKLVIPQHGAGEKKRGGHPVRVPRARFAELMALDPEAGLKALVDAKPANVERLTVADKQILVDIDTPEDFARKS
ncbi:MAG TPA: nucleotidyltransferase family protein [Polyangia bacterium]|nr:nucleotidyltransferase family protein [Polyangia bacterium]